MGTHAMLKSTEEHLKEKRHHAAFREPYELDQEKLKVAKVIIGERVRRQLTQAALARQLGVTQQQVSKIENGDFDNLATVQHVLGMLGYQVRVSAIRVGRPRPRHAHAA